MAKAAYIGVLTPIYKTKTATMTSSNVEEYFDVANMAYGFFDADDTGYFISDSIGMDGITAETTFTAKINMPSVSFEYGVSSQSGDTFYVDVAGTTVVDGISGSDGGTWSGSLSAGDAIVLIYVKDASGSSNGDCAQINTFSITYNTQTVSETKAVARKVKSAYVGVVSDAPIYSESTVTITSSNVEEYFTVIDDDYYFSGNTSGRFRSTNGGCDNSFAETIFTANSDMSAASFNYESYGGGITDYFNIMVAGEIVVDDIAGSCSGTWSGSLSAGDEIVLSYTKGSEGVSGDYAQINNFSITCKTQTGTETRAVARKITSGYIGVSGVARQFYDTGMPVTYTGSSEWYSDDILLLTSNGTLTVDIDMGNVDICLVGGGNGGYSGDDGEDGGAAGGSGGTGGMINNVYALALLKDSSYEVVIGAGGSGTSSTTSTPGYGQETTFYIRSEGYGYTSTTGSSTDYVFGYSSIIAGGSGGNGGQGGWMDNYYDTGGMGEFDGTSGSRAGGHGGRGGDTMPSAGYAGGTGDIPGGGGGGGGGGGWVHHSGGSQSSKRGGYGGNGASGGVFIRFNSLSFL